MDGDKILDSSKRYKFTRRYSGRRAITPMRSKLKKIQKTRGHKIEKKHVPLCKQTGSYNDEKWSKTNHEDECSEYKQREGLQNGSREGGEQDQKEQTRAVQKGNEKDSTESIHPGPIQALPRLFEDAARDDTQEEPIEAEQLL